MNLATVLTPYSVHVETVLAVLILTVWAVRVCLFSHR